MPNLAFHAACSVYYPQRTRLECYKGIDRKIAENNSDMVCTKKIKTIKIINKINLFF